MCGPAQCFYSCCDDKVESRDDIQGERRRLTVMSCDVVGSTSLSEQLDPEELRELMRSYQEGCVRAITSSDGYVGQYLGDGVLAQFTRDPNLKTEVEVRFIAEGSERTRVELEHRLLENYGEQAEMMQSIFDSDGGWTGIMARFATQAAGGALSAEVPCSADQLADQPK